MGALIFAVKAALSAIPNVQLNAVLIILTTVFFGWKALATVWIYVLLEGLIFGFSTWWLSYVFIWPLLVVVAMLFRQNRSALLWAVIAGFWGLLFGLDVHPLVLHHGRLEGLFCHVDRRHPLRSHPLRQQFRADAGALPPPLPAHGAICKPKAQGLNALALSFSQNSKLNAQNCLQSASCR